MDSILLNSHDCLHKNGAKIDMKNEFGHSWIHITALDNMNIVNMIFEKGCDPNAKDNRGKNG